MTGLKKRGARIALALIILVSLMSLTVGVLAQEMTFEKLWPKVQKEGVLRIGVAACEPHAIKDPKTGEWSGVAVNVMKKLAEALDVELKCVDTTWDYIIAGCLARKWDIAVALNERATRALVVNFSIPFYFYEISFVYNKNNSKLKDAAKFEDFDKKGLKCALMSGTAQDKALTKIAKNMEIVRLPDLAESRMAVTAGRADFLADDAATNYLFALANSEWAKTYIPDPPISREGISFGLRKSVSLEEIQVLDIVIKDCINKGYIREWEKEFGTLIIEKLKY